ncbi:hypothetical protein BD779DRAFT_841637 [Infundibulicybe gibba]|nr:hypothetical protein BD779DRAFT_841637 [Infundibulicybe gibba]
MALPKLDLPPFLSSSSSSSSLSSLSSPTASSESRTPVESEATELVHRQAEPSDTDPPLPIPGPRAMIRTTQITQASVANQDSMEQCLQQLAVADPTSATPNGRDLTLGSKPWTPVFVPYLFPPMPIGPVVRTRIAYPNDLNLTNQGRTAIIRGDRSS